MLEAIAVALAGRAGARLAGRLAAPVSRMTLLRIVRALPERTPTDVSAVGVDDFALRRGYVYGTVVIDINSHRPLDVLSDRTANTLEDWLKQHPGIRIVCRDRAGAYADGARAGAPAAVQVADRWHLWHNLAQAVEKTVIAQRGDLVEPSGDEDGDNRAPAASEAPKPSVDTTPVVNRLTARTRSVVAVHELGERGRSISAISRELGLDRRTVRCFTQATHVEQLLVRARSRGSLLDALSPTCTSGSTPDTPTPPRSPPRSPASATGAASRPCAATCTHSDRRSSRHHRSRSRRRCGRSPGG